MSISSEDLVGAIDFVVDASGLLVADVDYTGLLFSHGWDGWDTAPAVDPSVTAACIFPEDQVTDRSERFMAEELVREKLECRVRYASRAESELRWHV